MTHFSQLSSGKSAVKYETRRIRVKKKYTLSVNQFSTENKHPTHPNFIDFYVLIVFCDLFIFLSVNTIITIKVELLLTTHKRPWGVLNASIEMNCHEMSVILGLRTEQAHHSAPAAVKGVTHVRLSSVGTVLQACSPTAGSSSLEATLWFLNAQLPCCTNQVNDSPPNTVVCAEVALENHYRWKLCGKTSCWLGF